MKKLGIFLNDLKANNVMMSYKLKDSKDISKDEVIKEIGKNISKSE